MASATMTELYKLQPASRTAIQKSAGYAVFDNVGTSLVILSTAHGSGIAVNSKTKQETFMKMLSAGAGLGMGVKDDRVIFVFETPQALSQFLTSGWEASGQADAVAKAKTQARRTREQPTSRPVCGSTITNNAVAHS